MDLAGGTLDIWPLYLYNPGAVTLNFAINRWTRCVLETQETPEIRLRSGDLEAEETFASFDELHASKQPRLPLVTYVLRFFKPHTGLLLSWSPRCWRSPLPRKHSIGIPTIKPRALAGPLPVAHGPPPAEPTSSGIPIRPVSEVVTP